MGGGNRGCICTNYPGTIRATQRQDSMGKPSKECREMETLLRRAEGTQCKTTKQVGVSGACGGTIKTAVPAKTGICAGNAPHLWRRNRESLRDEPFSWSKSKRMLLFIMNRPFVNNGFLEHDQFHLWEDKMIDGTFKIRWNNTTEQEWAEWLNSMSEEELANLLHFVNNICIALGGNKLNQTKI